MAENQPTPLSKGDRWEPVLLLTAVGLGLGLARAAPEFAGRAEPMISPALILVLFAIFYRVPIERLRTAFGHRPYLGAALGLNFLLTPLVAYALGWIFLRDVPALWVGLVLVLVTPCTDWYLAFTALARGDVALNLALLPWNLVLQLVLLPVYLSLLTQSLLPVDWGLVLRSVVVYVLFPFVFAQLMRRFFPKGMENRMVWVQYIGFTALLVAMFAHQGRVLFERPIVLLRLVLPVSLFLVLLALVAVGVGHWLDFSAPTRAALASTACARNSPLTLSLALLLFPGTPLVALTQVVEPLIELPLLILLAFWLRHAQGSSSSLSP